MAMREEEYAQEHGASRLWGRTEDQWGCRSSTLPSRVSLERRNRLLSKGSELTLLGRRDKMEISGKMIDYRLLLRISKREERTKRFILL
jgi:hypothetical protein